MQSYLSGRGASMEDNGSSDESNAFSSYLATPSKQHSVPVPSDSGDSELNTETDVIHEDESGIKVEVVSVDNSPVNILIHIPDGRVIDLTCEY